MNWLIENWSLALNIVLGIAAAAGVPWAVGAVKAKKALDAVVKGVESASVGSESHGYSEDFTSGVYRVKYEIGQAAEGAASDYLHKRVRKLTRGK